MAEKSCSNTSCSRESCEGCPSSQNQNQPQSFLVAPHPSTHIKNVIGIVSGKGGVGKSLVTASLANLLKAKGHSVGILDADVTGPSIPKMFGLHDPDGATTEGLIPATTANGVKVMSVNLLMPNEEEPVIWRGPVISGVVKQFWQEVMWGDLDYLLVDMPPGTGDVPLTVFQSLPVDGVVIVTSPQDLVKLIVKKAYNMTVAMDIPVVGLVENYSYMVCPECGKQIKVFGDSHIDEIGAEMGLKVLGKLPINPALAEKADEGKYYEAEQPDLSKAVEALEAML